MKLAALIFVVATGAPVELHVLQNGNVRFEGGPELSLSQFESKIQKMAKAKDCPGFHVVPDRTAKYADVAAVFRQIQKYGCGGIGFTGIERTD